MDYSTIICDEVIKMKKSKLFHEILRKNKLPVKHKVFTFYFVFLFITIALLTGVSVYCCLIKSQAKALLPFEDTNNKLNKFCIDSIS